MARTQMPNDGLLPLLPNAPPGRSPISPPTHSGGQRGRRRIDPSQSAREAAGTFIGEFPPVAVFPAQKNDSDVDPPATGNGLGGSLASSRGFVSAGSMVSSRGFAARSLAATRHLAGCPPGGMRFFGNATVEMPLVASMGAPAPSMPEIGKPDASTGSKTIALEPLDIRPTVTIDDSKFSSNVDSEDPMSPRSSTGKELGFDQQRLEQVAGRALHTVHLGDLRRSKPFRTEMQALKLHDYFDVRGTPRFRRLGLSFAAKQNKEVKDSFGSTIAVDSQKGGNRKGFSAKSYFCATQAILKDIRHGEELKLKILKSVDEMERYRAEDVQLRQLEALFLEVPDFERHMPPGIRRHELLPVTMDKDAEIQQRRTAERAAANMVDQRWVEGRRMGWMISRQEALVLSEFAVLWTRASRTTNCPFGIDRPTFCRMIIDLRLVDQDKVPFYWAVSLFDSVAQPVRCCPQDATWSASAPAAHVANRWALLSIFDVLIRQHFDEATKANFFEKLHKVAEASLPPDLSRLAQGLAGKLGRNPTPAAAPAIGRAKDGAARGLKPGANQDNQPLQSRGNKFKNRVQSATVHFKMLTNVMVGLNKAADLEIDDDGTKNIQNLANPQEEEKVEKKEEHEAEHEVPPPWTKPPELSAPNLDTANERVARDRLAGSMLLEPEVLHLVAQYQTSFQKMHQFYADDTGHMSFPMLLQFCTDFRLTPQLVSSDILQGAYSAALTIETLEEVKEPTVGTQASEPPEDIPLSPDPESPRLPSEKKPERGHKRKKKRQSSESKFQTDQGKYMSNMTDSGIEQAQTGTDSEMESQSPPRLIAAVSTATRLQQLRRRSSEGDLARISQKLAEAKGEAKEDAKAEVVVTLVFGVSAFVEALCRVAFVHMGSYGNMVQQSSTAYARMVWLLTYLRHIFSHLKARSATVGREDGAVPPHLLKALRALPEGWVEPEATVPQYIELGEAVVTPVAGIGHKRKRRRTRQPTHHCNTTPRLAPSLHITAHAKGVLHKLAVRAKESLTNRQTLDEEFLKQHTSRAMSGTVDEASPTSSASQAWSSFTGASVKTGKDSTDVCSKCGATFKEGAATCRKCGAARPEAPRKTVSESASRPESVSSYFDESSSDESEPEKVLPPQRATALEVDTPVARGRKQSSGQTEMLQQTKKLTETKPKSESWSLDDLFQAEAGKPCVVNGHCTICESDLSHRDWGNVRCRGCSIVDSYPFERHLFRALLQEGVGRPPGSSEPAPLVAAMPPAVDKYRLTPPPVGDLECLLRKHFGHT